MTHLISQTDRKKEMTIFVDSLFTKIPRYVMGNKTLAQWIIQELEIFCKNQYELDWCKEAIYLIIKNTPKVKPESKNKKPEVNSITREHYTILADKVAEEKNPE